PSACSVETKKTNRSPACTSCGTLTDGLTPRSDDEAAIPTSSGPTKSPGSTGSVCSWGPSTNITATPRPLDASVCAVNGPKDPPPGEAAVSKVPNRPPPVPTCVDRTSTSDGAVHSVV